MRIEKVYFNTEDGIELAGLLHTSEEHSEDKVILSVHGMGSNCLKKRDDIIARFATENKISYFSFNNRGQELINTVHTQDGKIMQGTVFEDVLDSYYDIIGAIKTLKRKGYQKIYLQGHSLGSTKIVYTYNKLVANKQSEILDSIKAVMLLSLVDLVDVVKIMINSNPQVDIVDLAFTKEKEGKFDYVIETEVPFLPYVSVKTFLRYYRDNGEINFAQYQNNLFEYRELNNIKVPIFMRWGNNKELITLPVDKITSICKEKINNPNKDISYIDGATHNYVGKEEILAKDIISFLRKV